MSSPKITFALQAGKTAFSLDLDQVIKAVRLAEKAGHIPPLGEEWWSKVHLGRSDDHA